MSLAADDVASNAAAPAARRPECALALAVLTALVYFPGLTAPFMFDDTGFLVARDDIRRVWPIVHLLDDTRPVGMLSFALNYAFTGSNPAGYRAVNIAIHVAAGLFLFGLVRRSILLPETPPSLQAQATGIAFAVALLFLVHPLATQAVTYIIQRFESLMAMFFLLSLYALVRSASAPQPRVWYIAAIAACWLGMLTKQVMVVFPFVALLYDRAFLSRSWREVFLRRGWVHAGMCAGWIALWLSERFRAGNVDAGSAGFGFGITAWQYLCSQPRSLLRYLQLSLWPDRLIFDYGWSTVDDPWLIYGLGSIVLLLLALAVGAWFVEPRIGFPALAFFAVLAPSSSILPIADSAYEYRMYLPLAAVCTLVVLGVWTTITRLIPDADTRRVAVLGLLAVGVLSLAGKTFARNREYKQPLILWRQSAEFNPQNGRAQYNVAGRLGAQDKLAEAEPYYEAALLSNYPDKAKVHETFANQLAAAGRLDEAVAHYRASLQLLPHIVEARLQLADVLERLGNSDEARAECRRALKFAPKHPQALQRLERLTAGSE